MKFADLRPGDCLCSKGYVWFVISNDGRITWLGLGPNLAPMIAFPGEKSTFEKEIDLMFEIFRVQ